MSTLPRFVFPAAEAATSLNSTFTANKERRPQIQLDTSPEVADRYTLRVPDRIDQGQVTLKTASTPPDSPVRRLSATVDTEALVKVRGNGSMTPPATPTHRPHSRSGSGSSETLDAMSGLRRDSSITSSSSQPSLDGLIRPGNNEPLLFPYQKIDYEYRTDEKGRKKPIGVGAWSDVFLATPSLPPPSKDFSLQPPPSTMTPPVTPVHSRQSSLRKNSLPSVPFKYAVKVPASTSAKKVLTAEARILSYLSQFPNANEHIVPFYGQDTRNGALVLKAMDGTLEDWIQSHLNTLDEPSRAAKLAFIFPTFALSLINSLIWMQDKSCIHADIKPSNILSTFSQTQTTNTDPTLIFSDFSSAILPTLPSSSSTSPLGAGTWEYLDPSLLSSLSPAAPSPATDLWSLAITLLYLILGASPFEAFKGNKYQMREMIKAGTPLACAKYDELGRRHLRRLRGLGDALGGWDIEAWLGKVLRKDIGGRCAVDEWKSELIAACKALEAKM